VTAMDPGEIDVLLPEGIPAKLVPKRDPDRTAALVTRQRRGGWLKSSQVALARASAD
jgi:hypothetical protein